MPMTTPTIDTKRKRVYVGTGNAYTFPAAVGTDSVIAMDTDTGKIVWQHQEVKGDAFINNCNATSRGGDNCFKPWGETSRAWREGHLSSFVAGLQPLPRFCTVEITD
jgi:polyvinyl alcohol dehydrogenase (cytochrome)